MSLTRSMVVTSTVILAIAQQTASGQTQPPPLTKFAVHTYMVLVDVTAADRNGNSVAGLSASDFAVTEDEKPQQVVLCEYNAADSRLAYYVLGYYAVNNQADGQYRRIKVQVNSANVDKVDYRAGYYAIAMPATFTNNNPAAADPGFTPPVPFYKPEAEYTEAARKAKRQGTVSLFIQIDAAGRIMNGARVVHSLGLDLDEQALKAVEHWRFKPAMKDGAPVAVPVEVDVTFGLW